MNNKESVIICKDNKLVQRMLTVKNDGLEYMLIDTEGDLTGVENFILLVSGSEAFIQRKGKEYLNKKFFPCHARVVSNHESD